MSGWGLVSLMIKSRQTILIQKIQKEVVIITLEYTVLLHKSDGHGEDRLSRCDHTKSPDRVCGAHHLHFWGYKHKGSLATQMIKANLIAIKNELV